jgi:hypothetical protein
MKRLHKVIMPPSRSYLSAAVLLSVVSILGGAQPATAQYFGTTPTAIFLTNALSWQKVLIAKGRMLVEVRQSSASPAKVVLAACSGKSPACPRADFARRLWI